MWQKLFYYPIAAVSERVTFISGIAGLMVFIVVLCAGIAFFGIPFKKIYEEKER